MVRVEEGGGERWEMALEMAQEKAVVDGRRVVWEAGGMGGGWYGRRVRT
jgi:hypothetical protein